MVHKDIDGILHDIREAHRKDTTTADTASPVAEIQKQMETALHYEGTEEEKKARLFLATLGIDYDKLTPGGICHADPYSQKVRTPEKPQ